MKESQVGRRPKDARWTAKRSKKGAVRKQLQEAPQGKGGATHWREVDFGGLFATQEIQEANREEVGGRLSPFRVTIDDKPCASGQACLEGGPAEVSCHATGWKLRVNGQRAEPLTLCEVRVQDFAKADEGEMPLSGVRVGEAANPGPYSYGGAASSGAEGRGRREDVANGKGATLQVQWTNQKGRTLSKD